MLIELVEEILNLFGTSTSKSLAFCIVQRAPFEDFGLHLVIRQVLSEIFWQHTRCQNIPPLSCKVPIKIHSAFRFDRLFIIGIKPTAASGNNFPLEEKPTDVVGRSEFPCLYFASRLLQSAHKAIYQRWMRRIAVLFERN